MQQRVIRFAPAGLVLGLLGVAAFLRLYKLTELPPGVHGDEAIAGMFSQQILQHGWIGPYVGWGAGAPSGDLYLMAMAVKLLGPTILAVRLTVALLAAASIPLIYLLGRQLFSHRVGLVAAALLTVSYWHIHFSRIGYPVSTLPFIELATLILLFLALRSGKLWHFAAGGVLLGFGIYVYQPFPLFLAVVATVLAYVFIRERRRWKHHLPRLALFFGVSLVVAIPFLQPVVKHGLPERYRAAAVYNDPGFRQAGSLAGKAGFIAHKAERAGASFFGAGRVDGVDGLGQRGLLDPITGLLFLGGMVLALWRVKSERYLLLVLGVGVGLLGGILSSDIEGQYRRIVVSLPFVFLAAGAFADYLMGLAERLLPRFKAALPLIALAGCLATVGYLNVSYYFRVLAPSPMVRWVFVEDLTLASRYLNTLDRDTYVYFYAGRWSWNYETRRFLVPDMAGQDRSREFGHYGLDRDRPGPVVFLLLPPYTNVLPELEAKYPGGRVTSQPNLGGEPAFVAYYLGPAR